MRKDHPCVDNWGPPAWGSNMHIKLRFGRIAQDMLERYEQQSKQPRVIRMETTQIHTAFAMIKQSDMILASALHPHVYKDQEVHSYKLPFPTPDVELGLIWSEILDQDSARVWFTDILTSSLNDL